MTNSLFEQRFSRRTLLRSGLLLGAGLTLGSAAGCATPTGTPGPKTVSLALNRSLVSLDNKLNQFDAALTVQRGVRQALTEIDRDLRPQLVLADRFELVAPTQWFVHLRPGIRYSDGTPVQVRDVATALQMYSQVDGSFVGGFFPEWPTVEQIDDTSFTLNTQRPVPVLDYLMSNILITPAAANVPEELQSGVGSGPYLVTESDRGTGNYTLVRNENYWGTPAQIESVRVRFVPDESNRVVTLRSGEVDVIDSITPDAADQLAGLSGVAIDRIDGVRLNQLFFNFRKPQGHPLADARVRRALTYAIDGRALVDQVLQGSATQSRGVIPLTLDGAVETGEYSYDPARARGELDALGIRDLELKIIWETGEFAADTDIMESVLQMLSAVGVRDHSPAVRTRWRHLAVAAGQGRRLGRAGQRLPEPDRSGPHHHAGHVRRHRGEGRDPGYLPRVHLSRDHPDHHPGLGGGRRRPARRTPRGRAAPDLGHVPVPVGVRSESGSRAPLTDRRCRAAPHELL
ncbi:ABC transporter substrate-binding protein [Rhodococcus opacus]|uniref:ABC transporter substrate-binding protein n=1 Tax=Rhodococcus opacus TaxID=37919 RepID=UPI0034D2AF5C